MGKPQNRRDFLKLLALLPPSLLLPQVIQRPLTAPADPNAKNVLIIVFDTLSAANISAYGYPRATMPNLARIAERATVYHNHYSGGNFTTPGTSSLLTATYPWTHRAVGLGRIVIESMKKKSLFAFFRDYYRIAYSHNTIVNKLFREFTDDISFLKAQRDLFLRNPLAFDRAFSADEDMAEVAYERAAKKTEDGYAYSLFFSSLYDRIERERAQALAADYPRGVPRTGQDNYFLLEQGVDWAAAELPKTPKPYLAYFHFLPPHRPYCPRKEYVGAFYSDTLGLYMNKPKSIFNHNDEYSVKIQTNERRRYDEYILYADAELGRLFDRLQQSGILEDTWLVFTSDHGEMNERGILGHHTPVLYQPVIHIPLLIVEPGQTKRLDVFDATNSVDVIPTLLKVTGHPIPNGLEGKVLPPYAEMPFDPQRSVFSMEAKFSVDPDRKPLWPLTLTMVKDRYKLIRYNGYRELGTTDPLYELFDIKNDPEEMNDMHASQPGVAAELRNEMLAVLKTKDRPPLAD
jgi:arylsulfatase A-like enzyme